MKPFQWLWYYVQKWTGNDVCPPNCPLCAVNRKQEAHYDSCALCQGPDYPCETMRSMDDEEQAAIRVVFPDLDAPTNGSRFPATVLPPWDWSKK